MAGNGGRRPGAGRPKGKSGKGVLEIREMITKVSSKRGKDGLEAVIDALFDRAIGGVIQRQNAEGDLVAALAAPDPAAARVLLEFRFGKPKETLDLSSQGEKLVGVGVVVPSFRKEV